MKRLVLAALLLPLVACGARTTLQEAAAGSGGSAGCGDTSSDPESCGACGRSCEGTPCEAGVCRPREIPLGGVLGCLAVDAANVYVADRGGAVIRVSKEDWSVAALAAGGFSPLYLASDGALVFVAASEGTYRVGVTGDPPLAEIGNHGPPGPITTSRDRVLTSDSQTFGGVFSMAKDGSDKLDLALASRPIGVAAGEDAVFFVNSEAPAGIIRASLDGGSVFTLAGSQVYPTLLALDASHVYWSDTGGHAVRRVSRDGGPIEDISALRWPAGIGVDDEHVYFATLGDDVPEGGGVHRAPKTGGSSEVIATGLGRPTCLSLDETRVYWLDEERKSLWVALKPP